MISMFALIGPDGYSKLGEILKTIQRQKLSIVRARMVALQDRPHVVVEVMGNGSDLADQWDPVQRAWPSCSR